MMNEFATAAPFDTESGSYDPSILQEASRLLDNRRPRLALRALLELDPQSLLSYEAQRLLVLACARSGRIAAAQKALSKMEEYGASEIELLRLELSIQRAAKNPEEVAYILAAILALEPDDISVRYELALYELRCRQLESAAGHSRILAEDYGALDQSRALDFRIAIIMQNSVAALTLLNSIIDQNSLWPKLSGVHQLFSEIGKDEVAELVGRIIAKWPEQDESFSTYLKGFRPGILTFTEAQECLELKIQGREDEAFEHLNSLDEGRFPDLPDIEAIIPLLPSAEDFTRDLIEDDGREVLVSAPGHTGVTLLVFTGLADKAGLPLQVLDAFCAAAGHSAIYLRDQSRTLYTSGVASLGATFDDTLDQIQLLLDKLGTQTLLCWGGSAGGFGAVRYGIRLKAKHILCAGGVTNFDASFLSAVGDKRGRLLVHRLNGMVPAEERSLEADLISSSGACRIDMWYGEEFDVDVHHAEFLRGHPNYHCMQIPGFDRHNTAYRIIASGALQSFLSCEADMQ